MSERPAFDAGRESDWTDSASDETCDSNLGIVGVRSMADDEERGRSFPSRPIPEALSSGPGLPSDVSSGASSFLGGSGNRSKAPDPVDVEDG